MPTRYSMNIRPIFGDNEPTFGESATRGIGSAIEQYLRRKQSQDEFSNKIADMGGTVDPQPGVMERMRSTMGSIRRHLPGYDPLPGAEANLGAGPQPKDLIRSTLDRSDPVSGATYPNGVEPIRGPERNTALDDGSTSRDGVTRSPIAEAIERAIYKGPGGMTAIAPTARGRRQQEIQDQIPLYEARNRSLDTERLRGQNAIALERERQTNRLSLEDDKQAARAELARIKAAQSAGGLTPYQQRRLAIEETNANARLRALGVSIDRTLAGEKVPEGIDRVVAERDPAAAGRIAKTEASKGAARGRLQTTRRELTTPAPKTGTPTKPIADRIAELKRQGFSKEQARAKLRAEGYVLTPGQ